MNTPKFFISPQPTIQTTNKYINYFYESLSKKVHLVNYNKKPFSRSIDFLRYTFKSDYMILNWPEDVIHLRFGFIQMFIAFISLVFFRVKGGSIIWICHNKESHTKKLKWLSRINRIFYTKIAQVIIVHSTDAIQHFSNVKEKVFCLNHPVYSKTNTYKNVHNDNNTDVLIWGNITPYKGLSEFINNYRSSKATFQVTIIGRAHKAYYKQLKKETEGLNVKIYDRFLNDDELNAYFEKSKIILLPYLDTDTFSSGSLIHSLSSNKIVIGPAVGNFLDLKRERACMVYKDYEDLFISISKLLEQEQYYCEKLNEVKNGIEKYYLYNSWDSFIDDLLKIISKSYKLDTNFQKATIYSKRQSIIKINK